MLAPKRYFGRHTGVATAANRRGAATVEFAVIVPVLVLLFIGMVEMSRAVQVRDLLTDAVRSGCRLAIQPGTSNAAVTANINQLLASAGIPSGVASITIQVNGKTADVATALKGDQVSVKVGVPATAVGWLTTSLFFNNSVIESETLIMMRQG